MKSNDGVNALQILEIVKARLGISSNVRDAYLSAIIDGVIDEVRKIMGIRLDGSNMEHIMFTADYATWRYQSRDESGAMPRHLQFRLHNLYIHDGGGGVSEDDKDDDDDENEGGEDLAGFKHCDVYPRSDVFVAGFNDAGDTVTFNGGALDYDCVAGQGTVVVAAKSFQFSHNTYLVLDLNPGKGDIVTSATIPTVENQFIIGRMYLNGSTRKVKVHGLDSASFDVSA